MPLVEPEMPRTLSWAKTFLLSTWRDSLLTFILIIAGVAGSLYTQSRIDDRLYYRAAGEEVYFNADVPRVFENMTDRKSDHFRTKVHPLFLMASFPPAFVLEKGFNLSPERSVQLVVAAAVGVWISMVYLVLRVSGSRMPDAFILVLLLSSSGAAIVWSAVPETYMFGSISLLVPLLIVAAGRYVKIDWKCYVAASAFSLSMTITNWMSGLLMSALRMPPKTAFRISVYAFYAVVTIWGVQQAIFKDTPFFLDPTVERHVMLRNEWGGPGHNLTSALFHGMITPELKSIPLPANPGTDAGVREDYLITTLQLSQPGSAGTVGRIAVGVWVLLLVGGVAGLVLTKGDGEYRIMLGLLLLAQIGLHTIYGEEAFLYSIHYMPLFILLLAWGARTKARPVVLGLAGLLVVLAAYNNINQFNNLAAAIHKHCEIHASNAT